MTRNQHRLSVIKVSWGG